MSIDHFFMNTNVALELIYFFKELIKNEMF